MSEWTFDIDEEFCACVIDWQKACDCVNWTKLMQILKRTGTDWNKRRLISKLYMEQNVNPLNAVLNRNCKSQLTEFFYGIFKFCAWYSKNLNILRTKRDKFVKQKVFCGEGKRHCSECLKNGVISLPHNGEDKFLN